MIKHKSIFELTSQRFVGHVNMRLANNQATIVGITVGDFVQYPYTESIEILQQYTIAGREQVIFARL